MTPGTPDPSGPGSPLASLWQGVRGRILISAATSALLCLGIAVTVTFTSAQTQRFTLLGAVDELVGRAQLARCRADPATWSIERLTLRVVAYDALTGRSELPGAEPLTAEMLAGLAEGRHVHRSILPWEVWGVARVARAGPCSALLGRPILVAEPMPGLPGAVALALTLALLVALSTAMILAVRPLVDRLERIASAASGVGRPGELRLERAPDAIGHIADTLRAAHERILADRRELEARHHALEDHLAAVAHDLRTPLASLQLVLEDLAARHPGPGVHEALVECAYVVALTENLHQATRLERGLDPAGPDAHADLADIVDQVAIRFGVLGRATGVTIEAGTPGAPVEVRCDPALAQRLVANLVHNALVHGGSSVGISLDRVGDRFELVVSDDGPPLDADRLERLRAAQVGQAAEPARTRGKGGLGAGIVNAVARGAGWEVWWECPPDAGLVVRVHGPALAAGRG